MAGFNGHEIENASQEQLYAMAEIAKEKEDTQFQRLAQVVLRSLDYYLLLSKIPTDKKGKTDQSKYRKQADKADKIQKYLVEGVTSKLTETENQNLLELNRLAEARHRAKLRGEQFADDKWHSKLEQLQQSSPQI